MSASTDRRLRRVPGGVRCAGAGDPARPGGQRPGRARRPADVLAVRAAAAAGRDPCRAGLGPGRRRRDLAVDGDPDPGRPGAPGDRARDDARPEDRRGVTVTLTDEGARRWTASPTGCWAAAGPSTSSSPTPSGSWSPTCSSAWPGSSTSSRGTTHDHVWAVRRSSGRTAGRLGRQDRASILTVDQSREKGRAHGASEVEALAIVRAERGHLPVLVSGLNPFGHDSQAEPMGESMIAVKIV